MSATIGDSTTPRLKSARASGFDRRVDRSGARVPRPLPPPPRSPRPRARASSPTRGTRVLVRHAGSGLPPLAPRTPGSGRGKRREARQARRVGVRERAEQSRRHLTGGGHPCGGGRHRGGHPPPPPGPAAPSSALAVASIFTSKYLQARVNTVACNFRNLAGERDVGAPRRRAAHRRRVARMGRAGRRAPIAARGGIRAGAIAVPHGGIALAREMASLFGVARAEPRRLGGRDFCVVRSRRNPAVALLLVRLTLCRRVVRPRLGKPGRFSETRDGRSRPWRWVPPAASPNRPGTPPGCWAVAGMNVMDVVREQPTPSKLAETQKRTAARSRRGVERRSPRTTRASRAGGADRIVGGARAAFAARARFERGVFSRGRAARRRSWRRSRRRARWRGRRLLGGRKAAERRDDRKPPRRSRHLARVHVARVRRVAGVSMLRPAVQVPGIVAVAATGEGATVSSVARTREVLTDARVAHRHDFERNCRR